MRLLLLTGFVLDVQGCTLQVGDDPPDACTSCEADAFAIVGFEEQDGLLVIEAEAGDMSPPTNGEQYWNEVTPVEDAVAGGASGQLFVRASPEQGLDLSDTSVGPYATYPLFIHAPGRYYVWARANWAGDTADTVHVLMDGEASFAPLRLCPGTLGVGHWGWTSHRIGVESICETNGRVYVDIDSVGAHELRIVMKEDSFAVDKWLLTVDPVYVPEGTGPAAATRR